MFEDYKPNKITRIWWSIQRFFKFGWWYDFKRGIKNIRRWMPQVWSYADWDGYYTMNMLITSLKFQKKRLEEYSQEIDETLLPKIEKIGLVISLLEKSNDESNYTDPIREYFDKIYGPYDIRWDPSKKDENGKISTYRMVTSYEEKLSPEEYEAYRTEYLERSKQAYAQIIEDRRIALKIIAEDIDSWWE